MSEARAVLVLTAAEDDTSDVVVAELEKLPTAVVRVDVGPDAAGGETRR